MSLIEAGLACWVINCIATAILAQYLGWTAAVLIIFGIWIAIAVVGLMIGIVDSAPGGATMRQRVADLKRDAVALCWMLVAVLAFPVAYSIHLLRERAAFTNGDASMKTRFCCIGGCCHC
ncbi:hypothetical protein G6L37_06860 [Agrobacterium rubi]|nr:hypothetical protein [Agrobacterium rubi]NTF25085.1 hypothetical protein [Agrobacterium rubi]